MKNSLLATAVASTLLLASSAHAFTGKIEFTGKLVDENPYWSVGIPAKSIQDAKGWQSKLTDGKAIKGDKTEFSFKKDIPFVEGHMSKLLTKKDLNNQLIPAGTEPVVTIAGYKLNWHENNEKNNKPKALSVKIKGKAYGSSIPDGKLDFSLTDGFILAGELNGHYWHYGGSTPNQARALSKLTSYITPLLKSGNMSANSKYPSYLALAIYHKSFNSYLGAFATTLSNFKATFDNNAIPEKWTASIPVTISYK